MSIISCVTALAFFPSHVSYHHEPHPFSIISSFPGSNISRSVPVPLTFFSSGNASKSTVFRGISLTQHHDDLGSPKCDALYKVFVTGDMMSRVAKVAALDCAGLALAFKDSSTSTLSISHGAVLAFHPLSSGDILLGNGSTNPAKNQPVTVSSEALASFLSIYLEKEFKEHGIKLPHGPAFKPSDHPLLAPLSLDGRKKYLVVLSPVGLPTSFGIEGVLTGELSQDMFNLVEIQHQDVGPSWLTVASSHSVTMSQILARNLQALSPILPQFNPNITIVEDPFMRFTSVDPADQEGSLQAECDALTERLQVYLPPPISVPVPVVAGTPANLACDVSAMGGADASVAAPSNQKDDEKLRLLAIHRALHGRAVKDPSTGDIVFQPATLKSQATQALSHSKKTTQISAMRSVLNGTQKTYQRPPLARDIACIATKVDMIGEDMLVGWVGNGKHITQFDKFASIPDMAKYRRGCTPLCLLPDSRSMSAQRHQSASARDARTNEELLGQTPENLTKVSTSLHVSSNLPSIDSIKSILGGYTLIANSFVKLDPTQNSLDSPPFHNMGFQFGEALSSAEFVEWYGEQDEYDKQMFIHWILSRIAVIVSRSGSISIDEDIINAIIDDTPELVNVQPYIAIENLILQTVASISSMVDGTSTTVPVSAFFTNSRFYADEEKRKADQVISAFLKRTGQVTPGGGGEPKRQRTEREQRDDRERTSSAQKPSPPASPPARREGEICWSVVGRRIPVPDRIDGINPLCLMHILDGSKGCPRRGTCGFDHPTSISEWHPQLVESWDNQIKSQSGLSWEPTRGTKVQ